MNDGRFGPKSQKTIQPSKAKVFCGADAVRTVEIRPDFLVVRPILFNFDWMGNCMSRSETSPPLSQSSKTLESIRPGDRITLPDIECRDSDIATYVELFDARHPIHTDEAYASKTSFGQRIAHGPFPVAAVLASLGEVFGETLIALTEIGNWRFLRPIPVGAKVPAEMSFLTVDRTTGRVWIDMRLFDGSGNIAQSGKVGLLLRRAKPKTDSR